MVLASLVFLTGVGLRDPWPEDEPRFAQVAREMVQSGQWFFPTHGGEFYSDKPPIFMWTIAGLYWLTDNLLHMMFKLGQCAQKRWNRITGFDHLASVIKGVKFKDGIVVKNANQVAA